MSEKSSVRNYKIMAKSHQRLHKVNLGEDGQYWTVEWYHEGGTIKEKITTLASDETKFISVNILSDQKQIFVTAEYNPSQPSYIELELDDILTRGLENEEEEEVNSQEKIQELIQNAREKESVMNYQPATSCFWAISENDDEPIKKKCKK